MRCIRFLCLLLAGLCLGAQAIGGPRSPWPDPEERAAFQEQELQRHVRLRESMKRVAPARARLQQGYDVTYYRLDLDMRHVELQQIFGELEAHLTVTEETLDSILFDFHDTMQVDSVFVDGAPANFTHAGYDLAIDPGVPLHVGHKPVVQVFYHGHPAEADDGLAFGWAEHESTPLIWSLSEPIGAREWWPCKDWPQDKADSLDVILRVDDWMVATSNGLLVKEIAGGDGSKTYHWKHRYPIATYLVAVTATNYERIVDEYVSADGDTMLIEHFVYPEKVADAREDLSITADVIGVCAERFGPYPFPQEKYGHALFPWGGAMEHQTNTSYGAGLVRGDHRYDWILVHELAHQWWGDMTSPADWRDIWLNEGFASYAEAVWFEHLGGFEDYRNYMVNRQVVVDPSGPLYDPAVLFDGNTVYNKGAWVVHMLRGVLGDSLFYAALDEYRARTAYRSTTTAELQAIVEEVADSDLDWFFEPWVFGMNRPQYTVSYLPLSESGLPSVAIHLDQFQQESYFSMPVDLEIDLEGGETYRARVWNDPDHQDYEFDLPTQATEVRVDPDDWILKRVEMAPYAIHITTTDLPVGVQDASYRATLQARGGDPPYLWSMIDALPEEIALDPEMGTLSGMGPPEGTYSFTIELRDSMERTDTQRFHLTVAEPDTLQPPPDSTGVFHPGLDLRGGPSPAHQWVVFQGEGLVGDDLTLKIFDLRGREIRKLWEGPVPNRSIPWDGLDNLGNRVPSGVYLAHARSEGRTGTCRVVWLWKK